MNVTMHLPPAKITGLTWTVEQTGTGPPVLQLCLHGNGTEIPLLVFRDLADLDEWIGGSALAKADFAQSLMRHAARPLVPQDPLTAVVEANARILREHGFYGDAEPLPGVPQRALHPREPLPDLPQREPRVRATSMTEHGQVIFTDYPGDLPQREPGVALGVTETQPGCTCMERDDPCAVHDAVRRVRLIPVDECSDPPAESCADAGCPEHGSVYAGLTEGLGSEDEPEPQPGGTIYAELSEEALAAHAPLASLAADPDEDGT